MRRILTIGPVAFIAWYSGLFAMSFLRGRPIDPMGLYIFLVVFVLIAIPFSWWIAKKRELRLFDNGFEVCARSSVRRVAWSDVSDVKHVTLLGFTLPYFVVVLRNRRQMSMIDYDDIEDAYETMRDRLDKCAADE